MLMNETVLWDDVDGAPVVTLQATHEDVTQSLEFVQRASTLGEIRRSRLDHAQQVLTVYEQNLEEEGLEVDDDAPFDFELVRESVMEEAPLPHRADVTAAWLGWALLREHCAIEGASPGGHVDGYTARDPEAFLQAIRDRGYELVHHPQLMEHYWSAL